MLNFFIIFLCVALSHTANLKNSGVCVDHDKNCPDWVSQNQNECVNTPYIKNNCEKSCGFCGTVDKKFDVRRLPPSLKPLSFLVGIWRAETGGKAIFPTIPVFTYGEQIEFSLPDDAMKALKALNYSAFAWDMNHHDALHSEYGYLAVNPLSQDIALTTVMDNGFVTIEEGAMTGRTIKFILKDIGRISFSRDLPVHGMIREWRLLDSNTFEHRLFMETLTHPMQMHTLIVYKKIYPQ